MEKMRVLQPFKDSTQLWLGLEEEGLRRKVFRVVDEELVGATNLVAGVTIFEPGERCAFHDHPESEEFGIALKGSGIAYDQTNGTEMPFKEGDWWYIPKGVMHQHYNDGEEPLWVLWCYSPPGPLPVR